MAVFFEGQLCPHHKGAGSQRAQVFLVSLVFLHTHIDTKLPNLTITYGEMVCFRDHLCPIQRVKTALPNS